MQAAVLERAVALMSIASPPAESERPGSVSQPARGIDFVGGEGRPRVAYISLVFSSSEGVYRKLLEQAEAARKLSLPFDVVWITTERNTMASQASGIRSVLVPQTSKLGFRVRQVQAFNRISGEYDAVFLRYPTIDPILLALCSPRSVAISEHHTKELEEMKLARDWRYPFEKWGGAFVPAAVRGDRIGHQ